MCVREVHAFRRAVGAQVAFGAVGDENRGEKPFKTLRFRDDPWSPLLVRVCFLWSWCCLYMVVEVVGIVAGCERGHRSVTGTRFWLRDDSRTDKKILDHLRLENAYGEA